MYACELACSRARLCVCMHVCARKGSPYDGRVIDGCLRSLTGSRRTVVDGKQKKISNQRSVAVHVLRGAFPGLVCFDQQ